MPTQQLMVDTAATVHSHRRPNDARTAPTDPVVGLDALARSAGLASGSASRWAGELAASGGAGQVAANLLESIADRAARIGQEAETIAGAARIGRGPSERPARQPDASPSSGAFRPRSKMTPAVQAAQLMVTQMISDGASRDAIRFELTGSFPGIDTDSLLPAAEAVADRRPVDERPRAERQTSGGARVPSIGLAHPA